MSYYTHHMYTDVVQYVHLDVPRCDPVDVHSEEPVSATNKYNKQPFVKNNKHKI
jgi:hypothetical protein